MVCILQFKFDSLPEMVNYFICPTHYQYVLHNKDREKSEIFPMCVTKYVSKTTHCSCKIKKTMA